MHSVKAYEEIIHPNLEPGVINCNMIEQSIKDSGYQGEAGRLQLLEEIEYDNVTTLRLEFQNILRIDHLWILPNLTKLSLNFNKIEKIENIEMLTSLKELDLSFNYIEKIENLETLVNLEVLSLFNNSIKVIENMDSLENLIILSLGNNKIESTKGIERFRFFLKLKVLNLEGNLISEDKAKFRLFVAAFLPGVTYYEYSFVRKEEREKGAAKYARELRDIESNEQDEREYRAKVKKELEDEERLSSSFVEYLNEHQLFESLFEGDEDGRALRMIGEEFEDLVKEYKNDFYAITQEIYKLGLARYEEREHEIEIFELSVEKGQSKAQKKGHIIIDEFKEFKNETFKKIQDCMTTMQTWSDAEDNAEEVEKLTAILDDLMEAYNVKMEDIWQRLMEEEIQIFESTDEAIGNFGRNIQEMMNSFLEFAQSYFVNLRDVAMNFSENVLEAAGRYISYMMASGNTNDVPKELKECLEDKDAVMNLVTGMRDFQMQKIDAREDKLLTRGRTWVNELLENLQNGEIERNRSKITEINFFLDQMRDDLQALQLELSEEAIQNQEGFSN